MKIRRSRKLENQLGVSRIRRIAQSALLTGVIRESLERLRTQFFPEQSEAARGARVEEDEPPDIGKHVTVTISHVPVRIDVGNLGSVTQDDTLIKVQGQCWPAFDSKLIIVPKSDSATGQN
ncbi:unnamed protein product [Echinostoma caproni]|uniref:NfeD domain-containing protein n=1 Tax=Echinostoma caproni TaxID=27848 RepID=A0A183AR98_9TREM|nr:unnamed protein product [Echinostoma caproni]